MTLSPLPQKDIDSILEQRKAALLSLQPLISKKLYYTLEKRMEQEQEEWYELLNIATKKQAASEKYSYVLDSFYFEQRLMNE